MTLVATHLSPYGIVLASDSNLTFGDGTFADETNKTFLIDHLHAGLSFAGTFDLASVSMEQWLPEFIAKSAKDPNDTLAGFARRLRDEFEHLVNGMPPPPVEVMVHIAGYVCNGTDWHPEFHFVRNVHHILDNGDYSQPEPVFACTEDFQTRDFLNIPLDQRAANVWERSYFNGYPPGRISYNVANQVLRKYFLDVIWRTPNLDFRPPSNLAEYASMIRLQMNVIRELFVMSDQATVGGTIQIETIAPP